MAKALSVDKTNKLQLSSELDKLTPLWTLAFIDPASASKKIQEFLDTMDEPTLARITDCKRTSVDTHNAFAAKFWLLLDKLDANGKKEVLKCFASRVNVLPSKGQTDSDTGTYVPSTSELHWQQWMVFLLYGSEKSVHANNIPSMTHERAMYQVATTAVDAGIVSSKDFLEVLSRNVDPQPFGVRPIWDLWLRARGAVSAPISERAWLWMVRSVCLDTQWKMEHDVVFQNAKNVAPNTISCQEQINSERLKLVLAAAPESLSFYAKQTLMFEIFSKVNDVPPKVQHLLWNYLSPKLTAEDIREVYTPNNWGFFTDEQRASIRWPRMDALGALLHQSGYGLVATLGCVPLDGKLTEEKAQALDRNHSMRALLIQDVWHRCSDLLELKKGSITVNPAVLTSLDLRDFKVLTSWGVNVPECINKRGENAVFLICKKASEDYSGFHYIEEKLVSLVGYFPALFTQTNNEGKSALDLIPEELQSKVLSKLALSESRALKKVLSETVKDKKIHDNASTGAISEKRALNKRPKKSSLRI